MALAQKVIEEEGFGGFYTGLSSGLTGMGCSWFTYYYWFNFLSEAARARAGAGIPLSNLRNLFTAAQAGTITCVLMEPVWVVNTRAKLAKGKTGGVIAEMMSIATSEGLGPLFGGIMPSLLLVSNPSIQFMVAEYVKGRLAGKMVMEPRHHFINGALSKLIATICTYPAQVLKTRLQKKDNQDNFFMCVYRVWSEDGWEGFYRGMGMKISQTVLTSAFMFFFYSILAQKVMKFLAVLVAAKNRITGSPKLVAVVIGAIIGLWMKRAPAAMSTGPPRASADVNAQALRVFLAADRDHNGWLSKRELKQQLAKDATLKEAMLQGKGYALMFEELDADSDGRMSIQEWSKFYASRVRLTAAM